MPSRILVTGSSGFIGSHLVRGLESRGHCVTGFSTRDGDIARAALPAGPFEHVFHLAGRSFVPDSWANPRAYYDTNALGTANVLELCRATKAGLTLMSSYVYGTPRQLPIPEEHPISAANPYAHSKILAEEIAVYYQRTFDLRVSILRSFNVYGPGQDERFLIPLLVKQALDPGRETLEVADDRPRRDYYYIDDLIALFLNTIGHPGGIYNAGSGYSASVSEVAGMINRAAGTEKRLIARNESRPSEILDVAADVSKAARELGWRPSTPLGEGLAATVRATRALQ